MTQFLSIPILILLPVIAILILFLPFNDGKTTFIRRFSKTASGVVFIYSLLLFLFFENFQENGIAYLDNIQIFEKNWIDILGIKLCFGVDALSVLLIVLTSFIFMLAIIASKRNIHHNTKYYYSFVFLQKLRFLACFAQEICFCFLYFLY